MKIKFVLFILTTYIATSTIATAAVIHCEQTYESKAFIQAAILSNPSGIGSAECDYKNPRDTEITRYKLPNQYSYMPTGGYWRSTMPGFQWCSTDNGGTANTCLMQEIVEH